MDLATILILYKTSFLVGALCFLYVQWQSPQNKSVGILAAAFGLLAVGSAIAGWGENGALPLEIWTFASFSIGVFGYAVFFVGIKRTGSRVVSRSDWFALVAPLMLSVGMAVTGAHLQNLVRATAFNLNTVAFVCASALAIMRDWDSERLPARIALAVSLLTAGLLSGLIILGLSGVVTLFDTRYVFFLLIMTHFAIALFTMAFVNERVEKELKRLLETDGLTGVGNRRSYFSRVPATLEPGDAVIMIDIDHFKRVNDGYGHEAGDMALVAVAREIVRHLHPQDVFGRLGGEEFGIFVRGRRAGHILSMAEQIRLGVRLISFSYQGQRVPLSISAGIGIASSPTSAHALLRDADQALYDSKAMGRDRVTCAQKAIETAYKGLTHTTSH